MKAELPEVVRKLRQNPDDRYVLDLPPAQVGALIRRHVRAVLDAAQVSGIDVRWQEEKGLLESIFVVWFIGTGRDLAPHVQRLIDLIAAAQ